MQTLGLRLPPPRGPAGAAGTLATPTPGDNMTDDEQGFVYICAAVLFSMAVAFTIILT